MSAITRWVLAHKRIVTLFWIALTVVGIASANSATKALDQKFSVPGKEGWETNVASPSTSTEWGATRRRSSRWSRCPPARPSTRPACGPSSSGSTRARAGAARRADRLLRLHGQSKLRLERRPHHVRDRVSEAGPELRLRREPGRGQGGPRGRSGHRRRGRARPRERLRRASERVRRRQRDRSAPRVPAGRPGRPDRARVRLRVVPGLRADRDGDRLDHDHVPPGLGLDHVHGHLAGGAVPDRPGRARDRDRLLVAGRLALARGARPRTNRGRGRPARDGDRGTGRRLQWDDGGDRPAGDGRASGALPAKHGLWRHADPAGQHPGRDHPASGRALEGGPAARLAPPAHG